MMATALARMFEDDLGYETLIICPKNLEPMWEHYRTEYGLRGMVLPVSQVTKSCPASSATAWYSLTKAITPQPRRSALQSHCGIHQELRCQSHPADRDFTTRPRTTSPTAAPVH